ncbi:ABC transporter ATP-binding protein [uncultured Maritimibacter sp.]|jgi:branched-chain amino acid transport system ATP-binding protein|uniref:ABC transporter ATP-binding protein n=1 Tax=uncultured Maritimibacter sp. TaxID=991866 RepID=UPI000AC257EC|nr:ABC transporter ATP-binding protein [uncultured Maritimibacter sp.]
MFDARNISLRYGKHLAVDDVSISVGEGECVVILGANGAGKSSLLRGISRMAPIDPAGRITLRGADLGAVPAHRIVEEGIALVPEGRGVFTEMTVEDNLWLGSNPKRARADNETRRGEILALFPRLAERRKQRVGTMSGGEQQMVAIARALMSNPDLLFLDEPSLGLAPIVVKELFATLTRIKESGVSMLLVEQNVTSSLALADRGYVLEAGRITSEGTARELSSSSVVMEAFLGH